MMEVSHEKFIEKLNNKFPNKEYKVIGKYKGSKFKVKVQNKYGVCNIRASNLLKGCGLSLVSAIDKNKFYINKAKEVHNNLYDYTKTNYVNSNTKIKIICKKHGVFKQDPKIHLLKAGCSKCATEKRSKRRTLTESKFIEKALKVHGDKYDYSLVEYEKTDSKVKIICKKHGIFEQAPSAHFLGKGCYFCGRERIYKENRKNPTGWKYSEWRKAAEKSKNFDSFKVYIIKCWNDEEEFYKVGKTFRKLEERFVNHNMPYNYKILKIESFSCAKKTCKREEFLKNINTKYKPNMKFSGYTECFKEINGIGKLINYESNIKI